MRTVLESESGFKGITVSDYGTAGNASPMPDAPPVTAAEVLGFIVMFLRLGEMLIDAGEGKGPQERGYPAEWRAANQRPTSKRS
jgi:hypothetical protein